MSQTLDPSLRGRTTQKRVLQAFVARLIDAVEPYNEQNCFVSDQPIPLRYFGGREFCTVSPGGGRFPSEFFSGGGDATLSEDATIVITPGIVRRLDKPHKKDAVMVDLADSLMDRKHQILAALFASEWEPAYGTQPLLRDMPSPVSVTAPADAPVGETNMLALQLTVATLFDWDLESA